MDSYRDPEYPNFKPCSIQLCLDRLIIDQRTPAVPLVRIGGWSYWRLEAGVERLSGSLTAQQEAPHLSSSYLLLPRLHKRGSGAPITELGIRPPTSIAALMIRMHVGGADPSGR